MNAHMKNYLELSIRLLNKNIYKKIIIFFFVSILFGLFDEYEKISDYKIYDGDPHLLITNDKFTPYELITPLFTDYAWKHRTIYIPDNKKIIYNHDDVFDFPIGTIISKTFYYPHDFNDLSKGISLKETRILIHKQDGWVGLPYIWNENETEAYLEIAGGTKNANWTDVNGISQQINYVIPNMNQCKGCHQNNKNIFLPIGPKARQLNTDYKYRSGKIANQIIHWNNLGYFKELPDEKNIPKIAKWDNPITGNLDKRARAWLDINCAHCHNINGPANNTGLYLDYYQSDNKKLGIYKTPVAAGRGSGHLKYDIVPGYPEKSILVYRFESTDPGIMMPELGRTMVHQEGLDLIKKWILSLDK